MRAQFQTKSKLQKSVRIPTIVTLFTLILIPSIVLSQKAKTQSATILTINHNWDGAPIPAIEHAELSLNWLASGDLQIKIDAPFANEPPPDCANQSCWELWEYEVIELFLVGEGDPTPYTEVEISPWGNYLVLQLLGSRNIVEKELPLNIVSVHREKTRWKAEAILSKDLIPSGDLSVNAYRIHAKEPDRNYHVMTPMSGSKPDFHRIHEFKTIVERP